MVGQAIGWIITGFIYLFIATGALLALVVLGFPLAFIGTSIVRAILNVLVVRPIRFLWRPFNLCVHGTRGGERGGSCKACDKLTLDRIERSQRAAKGDELHNAELMRLNKAVLAEEVTLRELEPGKFEDTVCALYRSLGYVVEQTPRSRDGGRDAVMYLGEEKVLLECKRYNQNRAGRPQLQKFHSAMVTDQAERGIFVCLSGFSKEAASRAVAVGIELVDSHELLQLMRKAGWSGPNSRQYISLCEGCGQRSSIALDDEAPVYCTCGELISRRLNM